MLPEEEIQLEKMRVTKQIKNYFNTHLDNLNWNKSDFAKNTFKSRPTISEFLKKDNNYETDTLIENSYYLGCRVLIIIEPHPFIGVMPEKKPLKK